MTAAWARAVRVVLTVASLLAVPGVVHAADRLDLEAATADALATIDGVTPELAAAIVRLRAVRGGLGSVEALRILPGVDDTVLARLRAATFTEVALPTAPGGQGATPEEVLARFADEPDIAAVQAWARQHAQVEPSTVAAWLRASRSFAALPQLRVEYRLKDDWSNGFRAYDPDGNAPTSSTQPIDNVLEDADVGQDRTLLVRATWDLDQLVMSSEQIRVIDEAQDVVKLRERVLGEVTRLYFERRRLQVDLLLDPADDLVGRVRDVLRVQELTAGLDAYTGGRFSEALAAPSRR